MQTTKSYASVHANQSLADMLIEAAHDHCDVKNRRGQERYPYSIAVCIGRIDEHGEFKKIADLQSTDVSLTGMGLLSKSRLPVNNVFWLEMKSANRDVWRIQARIIFCRPLFADVFRLGINFLKP